MKNKSFYPIIFSLILIAGIVLGQHYIVDYSNRKDSKIYSGNQKINSILQIIEDNYVDGFDLKKHEDKILESIMSELDPHSTY